MSLKNKFNLLEININNLNSPNISKNLHAFSPPKSDLKFKEKQLHLPDVFGNKLNRNCKQSFKIKKNINYYTEKRSISNMESSPSEKARY